MHSAVKSRIAPIATENGWNAQWRHRAVIQKDGYEIYFFKDGDGFELTIRDPTAMDDRQAIFSMRDGIGSPAYVATLMYILQNVEEVVHQCSDEL